MVSKSELKVTLSQLNGFKKPRENLEQYITPVNIAADVIYQAYLAKEIEGNKILDLGCGTGILSIGAAYLGGKVTGIDVDKTALKIAQSNLEKAEKIFKKKLGVKFKQKDIRNYEQNCDTVLTNPPFGIRSRKNKNLLFLRRACQLGHSVYVILHSPQKEKGKKKKKKKTRKFIKDFLHKQSAEVKGIKSFACQVKEKGKEKKIGLDMYHIVVNNGN